MKASIKGRKPAAHYALPTGGRFRRPGLALALWLGLCLPGTGCTMGMAGNLFGDPRFILGLSSLQVYFNDPGVDMLTGTDKKIDTKLIKLIEKAEKTVDMAVYNLGRKSVIEALTIAEERGLKIRMVGDVDEVVTDGYRSILQTRIPFSLGNSTAIMHDKFAVIDKKYVFMGTGNITDNGFLRNNNNFWIIESNDLANAYTKEFEQMYYGKYGSKKNPLTSNFHYRVDFTPVDLYFSPYNGPDAMKRMIALVDAAHSNIKYMIFADTHDELSGARIRAAKRGVLVRGVHDATFVRGTSEEAPRMYGASRHLSNFQIRRDGNEHYKAPGLSSHGGKLHTKTIIIDDAVVCTGSFNWSNNAVENNDENMICVHNPLLAQETGKQWQQVWDVSKPVDDILKHPSGDAASPGDVVISEVMWAGSYGISSNFLEDDDDWIELRNMTTHAIDLSHWTIAWDANESVTYPLPDEYNWYKPGVSSRHYFTGTLIIPAGGYFLIKGQNKAINLYDNKVSGVKNFELSSSGFQIKLYDAAYTLIDQAGNGDPPLAGKSNGAAKLSFSMERFFWPTGTPKAGQALPGASPGSWYTSNGNNGLNGTGPTGSSDCTNAVLGLRHVCGTGQLFDDNVEDTISTPAYSGSSATASQAYGAYNQSLNTPLYAWATSSTSATIQMRWGLTQTPTITSAALCGGACPGGNIGIDPSDPSRILLSGTVAQTAGNVYALNVNGGTFDVSNPAGTGTIFGGLIGFNGYEATRADMRITVVAPSQSSSEDVIELTAQTGGTLRDLGVYYYEPNFGTFPPVLLYRMSDVHINAGQKVRVTLDLPGYISDDRVVQGRCEKNGGGSCAAGTTYLISFDDPEDDGGGCTKACSATTYDVFSPVAGIQQTDGIIFIGTSSSGTPMDAMCFSNRDGDILEGLMNGGFRAMYGYPATVYSMNVFPVDNNNDYLVESQCADYSRGGSAGNALIRTNVNGHDASAWKCDNNFAAPGTDC